MKIAKQQFSTPFDGDSSIYSLFWMPIHNNFIFLILLLRVSSNRFEELNLGRNVLIHKIGKSKCLLFELKATFQCFSNHVIVTNLWYLYTENLT